VAGRSPKGDLREEENSVDEKLRSVLKRREEKIKRMEWRSIGDRPQGGSGGEGTRLRWRTSAMESKAALSNRRR